MERPRRRAGYLWDLELTLVGFLHGNRMNVSLAPQRIAGIPVPDMPAG